METRKEMLKISFRRQLRARETGGALRSAESDTRGFTADGKGEERYGGKSETG